MLLSRSGHWRGQAGADVLVLPAAPDAGPLPAPSSLRLQQLSPAPSAASARRPHFVTGPYQRHHAACPGPPLHRCGQVPVAEQHKLLLRDQVQLRPRDV